MLHVDFLRLSARRVPNKTAIIAEDRRITYGDFDAAANQLANALLALGLPQGSRVAIQSQNLAEYAIAYFGIARAGYVSVHISVKGTASDLAFMLNKTSARVLLVDAERESLATKALADVREGVRLVVLGNGPSRDSKAGATTFNRFVADQPATYPITEVDEGDPAAITFTGGTTGLPKGVLVTHKARAATVHAALAHFGLNEMDVLCTATPLFHAAGLFVVFMPAVALGNTVVLQRAWDVMQFVANVQRHRITATLLVPSQLNELVSHPKFDANALASLRKIGYAGSPMGRALFERIRRALPHSEFTENYGQTETGPLTVRCPWHPSEKLNTVGRPAFNVEIVIRDPSGQPVRRGEIGEICTRGSHVFQCYHEDPEQTAAAFRSHDGWLWTGDVGLIDEDGYLTLVDRSKDMLISGGENVYPAEIENALYQHDAVAECAVFGIPDDRWGEVPAAHVVLKLGTAVAEDDLIAFCARVISRHKRPRVIKFVDRLPRTPVGKIQKSVLREPYWRGRDKKI